MAPPATGLADSVDHPEERVCIVGTRVSAVDMSSAIALVRAWTGERKSRYVCVTDVHSVMLARSDPALDRALENADLIVPDGMPLVWAARVRGVKSIGRVAGSDFMHEICRLSSPKLSHFLLGGAEGVPDRLASALKAVNPQITICGTESPPFRQLTEAEDHELVERINAAKPSIVWVGLGCPKQELWMSQHAGLIPGATLIGVGAAFNFLSGNIKRAPLWMRNNGLEWLHRLVTEPRRLWRRYLMFAPMFVVLATAETVSLWWRRAFNSKTPHSTKRHNV
jgi:N-acetylglucosaminyldiphosphoundecaprenol N-acetyl-beta-D-mannosaminyltransferase